ncbi:MULTISPECIES: hypothetical protein [unclassified Rhizobium]|uniref:hypothetical protein n=1 Tax=unclassified Rhizobium TaxID=2613769 RepID=UPI00161BB6EB|nr:MULTISPECIES: hypothetical protein [unclassified Rhizobium]MBB3541955.1 AraC-like DNA-binding protein [Rhizobium sp. BK399]MCS3740464.1 AraC-like DNA-binding protein [Rhizobium sp. BK661]MCS4094386.1 AraC-like DNA-binding protein [Rhizobium sp. BK176]
MLTGRPHTRDEILHHPLFLSIERQIALHLIGIHKRAPRLARLAASHQKWLLTQTLFAMHTGRDKSNPVSGLTAGRMMQVAKEFDLASKNTAASFLAELIAYKFLRDAPDETPDRRLRRLETTELSEEAMASWFQGHMACLDQLDGANRGSLTADDPRLFYLAQPRAARALIQDPVWKEPRASIGHFLWSDVGGLVLHDLISRLPDDAREQHRILLKGVSISEIANEFGISLTNLKRMFKKAERDDMLGWESPRSRGALWLSRTFIEDYFYWQSAKFAELDRAIHWAAGQIR